MAVFSHNRNRRPRRPKPPRRRSHCREAEPARCGRKRQQVRYGRATRWSHQSLLLTRDWTQSSRASFGEFFRSAVPRLALRSSEAPKLRSYEAPKLRSYETPHFWGLLVWRGSLAAVASVKPCLRRTDTLSLPPRLSGSSAGSPVCDVHHR